MRSRFSLAAGLLLSAVPGLAQIANPRQPTTHHPYIIELEQKREQTLEDGTHIVQISHQKRYRDSQGRTRVDYSLSSETGEFSRTNISVYDPNGKTTLNWMIGDHMESTYNTNTMPGSVTADVPHQSFPSATQSRPKPLRTNEQLGIQDVQGFACVATRSTTVYPVGMVGNDRPITSVYEHCVSNEFGLALSDKTVDPRSGTNTLTAVSISREEPNPSLFQPPAGFIERKVVTVPSTETH